MRCPVLAMRSTQGTSRSTSNPSIPLPSLEFSISANPLFDQIIPTSVQSDYPDLRPHLLTEISEDDANHLMSYLRPEIPEDGTDHLMSYPSLEVRGAMPFNSSARRDAVPVASSLTLHMANRLSSVCRPVAFRQARDSCVSPQRSNTGDRGPPLVKGDARLRQVLVNRWAPNCFSNGMIALLCLVPARMQEPLSKFLVSPWEQKGEGDPPLWSVRSHVPSPLISRRVSPFPLALSSRSSSYGVRLRCTTLSRAFSPRQSSIGIVQSPRSSTCLAHPTVEIKSSEITISYSGRPLSNNGRSTHVSSEPLSGSEWVSGFLTCSDGAPERAYT
ncbi:hypothetical protein BHE74_00052709 [Ensete ventricosum]|nr:hypothetical protein BHE74_00052709 [Ensete ventricosum]